MVPNIAVFRHDRNLLLEFPQRKILRIDIFEEEKSFSYSALATYLSFCLCGGRLFL